MKKFDAHLHCLNNFSMPEMVQSFNDVKKYTNTDGLCFMSCPTYHDGDILQNLKQIFLKDAIGGDTYAYAGLSYKNFNDKSDKEIYSKDFLIQVKTYHSVGFDGFKILEGKPSERRKIKMMLSDVVFDKMFAYLEEMQIPVTLHNSDPATFWDLSTMTPYQIEKGWYCGDVAKKEELFEDVMTVLKRYPNLKLTLAHFGFTSDNIEEAYRFLEYKNTLFDVTPGGEQYNNITQNYEPWQKLISKNADRFVFGTDTDCVIYDNTEKIDRLKLRYNIIERFFKTTDEYENFSGPVKGIGLSKDQYEKVLGGNSYNLLGARKPIDLDYIKFSVSQLSSVVSTEHDKQVLKDIKNHFIK